MATRILITDDHEMMRRMLKLLLQAHPGWEVCGEATNGLEAIAKAAELKPDVIVMDMAMPVMDGIRASREISTAMPTIPILMYTLHHSPELELEAKKAGVRRVVPKAQSGNGLLEAIQELLDGVGAAKPTVSLAPQTADPEKFTAIKIVAENGQVPRASDEGDLPNPD